ncbi:MAG: hypothetical protein PVS3B3_30340 [Ktedonobacteraceae bacterium]
MQKNSITEHVQQHIDKQKYVSSSAFPFIQVGRLSQLPYRYILWLFTTTRVLLILVTYIGVVLLTVPKYSSTPTYIHTLLSAWNHWDASNYVRIAQYGYQYVPDLAFFPLYPASIWLISHTVGNYLLVGMLLSNLALLGALVIIYQLALDVAGEQVARQTLLYLCIFPTAFYFFAAYNESFFLLFSAGAFLAMRRQLWLFAGLLGALAAGTRSAGILLVLPYLCEWWLSRKKNEPMHFRVELLKLAPICLISVGLLVYSYYCLRTTGNPLMFAAVQAHWDRHAEWPWQGIGQSLYQLWVQPIGSFYQVHILLDLCATLGFLFLSILGWRRLPLSFTLWSVSLLLLILLNASPVGDPLASNQRIVLELFPCFIMLAIVGKEHQKLHETLLLLSLPLLATLSIIFLMNRWMV